MGKDFRYYKDHRDRSEGKAKENLNLSTDEGINIIVTEKIIDGKNT